MYVSFFLFLFFYRSIQYIAICNTLHIYHSYPCRLYTHVLNICKQVKGVQTNNINYIICIVKMVTIKLSRGGTYHDRHFIENEPLVMATVHSYNLSLF